MRLLTSQQMREADRRTIEELGLPGMVLMENAGAGVERSLWARRPKLLRERVLVLAGRGNNGGDGFVVARRLRQAGVAVTVLLLGKGEQLKGDARANHDIYRKLGGWVRELEEGGDPGVMDHLLTHAQVVVDAVFGTGLGKPVTGFLADLFQRINRAGKCVVAVDLPSGVCADSGRILGEAIRADWTVTFASEKIGHRTHPGAQWCGEILTVPIGIPANYLEIPEHGVGLNTPDGLECPPRPTEGHKGTFGHLLVVAGGVGKAGAAALTALGAQRMGPGLVTVASPANVQPQVAALLLEAMTLPFEPATAATTLLENGAGYKALVAGPGLGTPSWVAPLLLELGRQCPVPMVLDADALNALAAEEGLLQRLVRDRSAPVVLTPHPGEMGRLLGQDGPVREGRLECARDAAQRWGIWVVLKGAGTVIAAPDGHAWINPTGHHGLAAGGSGDLLTGIIGGLLAQGWPVKSAVRAGVWLHGAAADACAADSGTAGMLARDLLPHLQRLRNTLDGGSTR